MLGRGVADDLGLVLRAPFVALRQAVGNVELGRRLADGGVSQVHEEFLLVNDFSSWNEGYALSDESK